MTRPDQAFRNQPSLFGPASSGPAVQHVVKDRGAGVASDAIHRTPAPVRRAADVDEGKRARNTAYDRIVDELPDRRRVIYVRILAAGARGVTLDEISAETGQSPNQFSGRVTELQRSGLVVRTRDRRQTRAGAMASVIVAREFLDPSREPHGASRRASALHSPTTEATMRRTTTDTMPDQLTCARVPRDQNGDPMSDGRLYSIDGKRVQCFEVDGTLWIQRARNLGVAADGSRPQLVGELPNDVNVHRLE